MIKPSLERLQLLCDTIPALLKKIDEKDFSFKALPEKWSKKEILGHLIDSATNNHHRFIRAQFEEVPIIAYDQVKWNQFSYYNYIDSNQLIGFWTLYNKQLLALLNLVAKENLKRECNTGGANNSTVEFLFTDYVQHLEHHLLQIVEY